MPPRFPADYVAGHNRARRKRLNCERDGDVLGLPTFPLEAGEGAGVSAEQPSSGAVQGGTEMHVGVGCSVGEKATGKVVEQEEHGLFIQTSRGRTLPATKF